MNHLYFGDCLDVLKELWKQHPQPFIDLIYIDPPFNSKRNYNVLFESMDMKDANAQKQAFADTWSNYEYIETLNELAEVHKDLYELLKLMSNLKSISDSAVAYLTTMAIRIYYMHKLLKDTGSFYLHCDPTMSHYLKLVCDMIFGVKNFRNEIIWCYRKWAINQNQFVSNHDTILFYAKSPHNTFNHQFVALSEGTMKRWKGKKQKAIFDEDGKRLATNESEESEGSPMPDWWEVSILNPASKERLGYPTQKPEALLERIIKASSNEGDIVADFFCGCGTTIAVAQRLNRDWTGADISHLAVRLIKKRLVETYGRNIEHNLKLHGMPKDIASARELAQNVEGGRIGFQDWAIEVMLNGVVNEKKVADGGYDGYLTFYDNNRKKHFALIETKSGKLTVKNLREFVHVIETQKATVGIFVCFEENVTREMKKCAKDAGHIKMDGAEYPIDKIQIITIENLFEGKQPQLPGGADNQTFKRSQRKDTKGTSYGLFD